MPKERQSTTDVVETVPEQINHPSRNLAARSHGYGVAAGYEKPLNRNRQKAGQKREVYGPLPPDGYYGTGIGARPFKRGQAGFSNELEWYHAQYGRNTSGYDES
ncbi:MAG TPA: hypothetical protein VKM94_08080 [Blastocatellia bacterium]|nr:hypothetical protein [Blastocatellia bacterium]